MEYMESMMNNRLEASMSEYEQMTDRIKELESQLAEAKKDQARYQWLDSISSNEWKSLHQMSGELLNSYIDAAIASIQGDGK